MYLFIIDIKNGDCPIGQVYMNGPATVLSCDNLHPEITLPAFYLGCFCTSGLVKYRDRCVDPLECPALLKRQFYKQLIINIYIYFLIDPPPFDPLPVVSFTIIKYLFICYYHYPNRKMILYSLNYISVILHYISSIRINHTLYLI